MTAPTRGLVRAVNMAAQTFLRSVGKVVGGEVIADAIAFFAAFEGMDEGFKSRARLVERLLVADSTAFVLVASPRRDTVTEAAYFAGRLAEYVPDVELQPAKNGINVRALVVNRIHPTVGAHSPAEAEEAAERYAGTALGSQYRALADLVTIASAERAYLEPLHRRITGATLCEVPFLPVEVHDLETLELLGCHLFTDVA